MAAAPCCMPVHHFWSHPLVARSPRACCGFFEPKGTTDPWGNGLLQREMAVQHARSKLQPRQGIQVLHAQDAPRHVNAGGSWQQPQQLRLRALMQQRHQVRQCRRGKQLLQQLRRIPRRHAGCRGSLRQPPGGPWPRLAEQPAGRAAQLPAQRACQRRQALKVSVPAVGRGRASWGAAGGAALCGAARRRAQHPPQCAARQWAALRVAGEQLPCEPVSVAAAQKYRQRRQLQHVAPPLALPRLVGPQHCPAKVLERGGLCTAAG